MANINAKSKLSSSEEQHINHSSSSGCERASKHIYYLANYRDISCTAKWRLVEVSPHYKNRLFARRASSINSRRLSGAKPTDCKHKVVMFLKESSRSKIDDSLRETLWRGAVSVGIATLNPRLQTDYPLTGKEMSVVRFQFSDFRGDIGRRRRGGLRGSVRRCREGVLRWFCRRFRGVSQSARRHT